MARLALLIGIGNVLMLLLWSLGPVGGQLSIKWWLLGHGAYKAKYEFRRVQAMNNSDLLKQAYLENEYHKSGEIVHLQSSDESMEAYEVDFVLNKSLHLLPNYTTNIKCDGTPHLIAFVASIPSHGELRQAVRETWARTAKYNTSRVHIIFLTGKTNSNWNQNETKNVLDEIKLRGDILVGDFVFDEKKNTTLPLLLGIRWALTECRSFQYLYFGFDYTVLNTDRLFERIRERNIGLYSRTWMGRITPFFRGYGTYGRNVFSPNMEGYRYKHIPPFCTDKIGYVMTRHLAKEVIESVPETPILPFADVFLGVIAQERNWTILDDNLFSTRVLNRYNFCGRRNEITMIAPTSLQELRISWKKLRNKRLLRNCPDPDLDFVLPTGVDNRPYLQKVLSYDFEISHACYDKNGNPLDIFMVVLISTPPHHIHMRTAIRKTWCKEQIVQGESIRCLFVMGMLPSESDEVKEQLRYEHLRYGDLLRANFDESFQNLTLKVILGLKWISENCPHAKYLYKGDDDMFVNFNNIISFIKNQRGRGEAMTKLFLGSRMVQSTRYSSGKGGPSRHADISERYHVPDTMYFGSYYPPYCSGGGYVMSTDTVPDMYRESLNTSLISVDDAFQGILAKKVGVTPSSSLGI